MTTKEEVRAMMTAYPAWYAEDVAEKLKCTPEYVRKTAGRYGWKFKPRLQIAHIRIPVEWVESQPPVFRDYARNAGPSIQSGAQIMAITFTPWPDADTEVLRKMWTAGKSGTEISGALDGRYTRSAVCGKAHRLGLESRDSSVNRHLGGRVAGVKKSPIPKPKPIIIDIVAPIAIGPMDDFPKDGCKWIAGDPSMSWQCCGHPIDRQSLCSFHANIAFTKPLPAKPANLMNYQSAAAKQFR